MDEPRGGVTTEMAQAVGALETAPLPDAGDILMAMPVAALLIGPDHKVAEANIRAEALFNIARSAMIGQQVEEIVAIVDTDLRADFWDTDKPLAAYDLHLRHGRAEMLDADLMIAPVGDHGYWRAVVIHAHGQAQRLAHRRPAAGTRSAMGAAAILAHEIKNPLSGIRGAAQLLEAGADQASSALTAIICQEVDRIAALIDRMQDFTTDQPLETSAKNIYPMLARARDVAAAGFARDIRIVEEYDPSLPRALVHADALIQILINLLKNAAEAVGDSQTGEIRMTTSFRHGVSVARADGRGSAALPIEIQISDSGPGVPDHIREHLFNPFVTGKREGKGLGLALVDKLVRDMDGLVQYAREGDPPRTIFRLLLPMAAQR